MGRTPLDQRPFSQSESSQPLRPGYYPLLALALSAALPDGQNVRNEGGAELPVVQEEMVPFMSVEEKPAFKGGDMNMFI